MAYDLGLLNVVEMIDVKNNQIHKYYKITPRYPRMRRPPAPTPLCLMYSDEEEDEEEELLAGGDSDLLSNLSHVEESSEIKTDNPDTKDILLSTCWKKTVSNKLVSRMNIIGSGSRKQI